MTKEKTKSYLSPTERETILSWNDGDKNKIFIYSSQQSMIRQLINNPLFKIIRQQFNRAYNCYPKPLSIEGFLPRNALTIRKRIIKRKLTEEQIRELVERLKKGKQKQNPVERLARDITRRRQDEQRASK